MIRFLGILLWILCVSSRAETVCEERTREGIAEFNAAYTKWSAERFVKSIALFEQSTAASGVNVTNHYWLGVAQFHLMLQKKNSSATKADADAEDQLIEAAIKTFQAAVKLDSTHAESHALLGTLYGMKIGDSFLRGAWLGPRLQKHHSAAVATGKDNPRVVYLTGMCEFHTADSIPKWKDGLQTLLRAEKLFDAESKTPAVGFEPRWGRSSCLTFIGKTYERLAMRDEALNYFQRALEAHPADHLAQAGVERLKKVEKK